MIAPRLAAALLALSMPCLAHAAGCRPSAVGSCTDETVAQPAVADVTPDLLSLDHRTETVQQLPPVVAEPSEHTVDVVNPIVSMSPHRHADMRGAPCAFASLGKPVPPSLQPSLR